MRNDCDVSIRPHRMRRTGATCWYAYHAFCGLCAGVWGTPVSRAKRAHWSRCGLQCNRVLDGGCIGATWLIHQNSPSAVAMSFRFRWLWPFVGIMTMWSYWHCWHGRRNRFYARRPSVCLSHSPAAAACGGFAAVGPAGRRYRSIAARLAPQQRGTSVQRTAGNVGSATLTADGGSWTQTC